jgi:sulfite reductase alpha subunit-like flavoprotein
MICECSDSVVDVLIRSCSVVHLAYLTRMAKDVHAALHRIIEKEGGMPAQAAEDYVHALKDTHRYHRDVY